ncbi:Uncharacterized protein GBIM_09840 [Gryllus bimaculatus]|nr:Uncharacterized protein GBIM_09840 [Gryllus bimaculatus]
MGAYQSGRSAGKKTSSEEVNFDHFQILRAIGKGSFGKDVFSPIYLSCSLTSFCLAVFFSPSSSRHFASSFTLSPGQPPRSIRFPAKAESSSTPDKVGKDVVGICALKSASPLRLNEEKPSALTK